MLLEPFLSLYVVLVFLLQVYAQSERVLVDAVIPVFLCFFIRFFASLKGSGSLTHRRRLARTLVAGVRLVGALLVAVDADAIVEADVALHVLLADFHFLPAHLAEDAGLLADVGLLLDGGDLLQLGHLVEAVVVGYRPAFVRLAAEGTFVAAAVQAVHAAVQTVGVAFVEGVAFREVIPAQVQDLAPAVHAPVALRQL